MDSSESSWGGTRNKSGRKKLDKKRKNITISLSQDNWDLIAKILKEKQKENPKITETQLITEWTKSGSKEDFKKLF